MLHDRQAGRQDDRTTEYGLYSEVALAKKNTGEQTWQWSSFFIVEDFMLQLEVLIVLTFWSNYVNFGDHVCGIAHS